MTGSPVNGAVIKQYLKQRDRGLEGFGFYLPETNRLTHNTREGRTLSLLRRNKASEILFHHRFPTSTLNVRNSCHPFSTKDHFEHNYVVVHNGVIWNDNKLITEHEAMGIKYVSLQEDGHWNDSEALAFDLARYLEGQTTALKAEGSIAFIAIQRDKKGKALALYFGRNGGSPLRMVWTDEELTLSSEGDGQEILPHQLYKFDYATGKLTHRYLEIPTGYTKSYGTSRSGDYLGYNSGYDWGQSEYRRPTSAETAQAILAEDDYEFQSQLTGMVSHVKNNLLNESYESHEMAIELGLERLEDWKKRERHLEALMEIDELDGSEMDEYCELIDQIWYLTEAIELLRKEYLGKLSQAQFGFHADPKLPRRLLSDGNQGGAKA